MWLCALALMASDAVRVPLPFANVRRSYLFVAPSHPKNPAPLVILLHGWTSSARDILESTGFDRYAQSQGWVLVAPDGVNAGWNAGFIDLSGKGMDDVAFVDKVIDDVSARAAVDPRRIYVVGHSNGAMLTYAIGARLSTRIAAIVVVSGTLGVIDRGKWRVAPKPASPVDVLILHGKRDPIVAYDRSDKALLVGLSAPDSAMKWARWDGIDGEPSRTKLRFGTLDRYARSGHEVDLLTLKNGFHEWPGGVANGRKEKKSGLEATPYIGAWLKDRAKGVK